MFTSQSTIERRAAKEKRLGGIEDRIGALENAPRSAVVDLSPLETRLASLEAVKPIDLSSIEARLTTLEGKPAPVVDFTPLTDRLAILEAVKPVDLTEIERRLVTLEAALKALTTNHSEGSADVRKRLDSAETNAAIVRKELDELKVAAAAKKTTTGGFTTAGGAAGNKNFAFPAKKKDDTTDA
jgi:hypothetical protein